MIQFLKNGKNYYPQKFPEECKYKFKEKTRIKCTTEDLTDSESGTDSDSHSENNDGNELDPKRNDEIWYQKYVWFFSYM